MSEAPARLPGRWSSAWLDALAFAGGLALAWHGQWQTRDLVWSLWLSSLVVGYAMIVWSLFGPAARSRVEAWRDRARPPGAAGAGPASGTVAYLVGGLLLAFFTVHFGMFHFVHSVFLNLFFPAVAGAGRNAGPSLALYLQVFATYWPFVLLAAVAERNAFRSAPPAAPPVPDPAAAPGATAARNSAVAGMTAPYRNVVRLHLLIFFFAFASFTRIDSFAVYAVVYAVYFFPWRLLRQGPAGA